MARRQRDRRGSTRARRQAPETGCRAARAASMTSASLRRVTHGNGEVEPGCAGYWITLGRAARGDRQVRARSRRTRRTRLMSCACGSRLLDLARKTLNRRAVGRPVSPVGLSALALSASASRCRRAMNFFRLVVPPPESPRLAALPRSSAARRRQPHRPGSSASRKSNQHHRHQVMCATRARTAAPAVRTGGRPDHDLEACAGAARRAGSPAPSVAHFTPSRRIAPEPARPQPCRIEPASSRSPGQSAEQACAAIRALLLEAIRRAGRCR